MQGWISLHRQIIENEFWFCERFTKAQAWIDLLLLATHKPTTVFIRGIEINLKPGELCYSQLTLAKRWKWNRKTVNKFLSMLQTRQMVDNKKSRVTTIISIKKWNEFQTNGQQSGQQKDNNLDTNNNDNNVNNLMNDEVYLQKLKNVFNLRSDELQREFYGMNDWLEENNKVLKRPKSFINNWLKKYSASRDNGKQRQDEVLEFKSSNGV